MRNQNVYIARVSQGLFVGAPGNATPLGLIQRAFVVSAHNDMTVRKTFRLSIAAQPLGGSASFLQFSSLAQLDVAIPPRSSISRTVFVQSSDPKATVQVDVLEIADGKVIAVADGGLQDSVVLNPDILNPEIMNPEIMNPEIMNPEIMNGALSDTTWTITNTGNTTSSFNVELLLRGTTQAQRYLPVRQAVAGGQVGQ